MQININNKLETVIGGYAVANILQFAKKHDLRWSVETDANGRGSYLSIPLWTLDDEGSLELEELLKSLEGEYMYGRDAYWFRLV